MHLIFSQTDHGSSDIWGTLSCKCSTTKMPSVVKEAEQREITNEWQQSPNDAAGNDGTLISPLMTDPGLNRGFLPHLFHAWSLGFRRLHYFPPAFFIPLPRKPTPSTPPSADVPFCSYAPAPRDRTKLSLVLTDSDMIASQQGIVTIFSHSKQAMCDGWKPQFNPWQRSTPP